MTWRILLCGCAHGAKSENLLDTALGVKWNFWLAKFRTSRHVGMHKVVFYISNTLRKLMIRAQDLVQRWSLETSETWSRTETRFLESWSRRSQVSSRSWRISVLVSRHCIGYFLWIFFQDCSKFSRSKGSVAKLSLLLCYLRDGENNLPSPLFKIYIEFNKNMYLPLKLQRIISARKGWEYFAKDYLWTVFPGVLLWNP